MSHKSIKKVLPNGVKMRRALLLLSMVFLYACNKTEDYNPYLKDDKKGVARPIYSYKNVSVYEKDMPLDLRIAEYRAEILKYNELVNSIHSYYVRKDLMKDRGMSDFYGREGVVAEITDIFKEDFDEKSTREYYEKNKGKFNNLDPKNDSDWLNKVKYFQLVDHITVNYMRKLKELSDRGELIVNLLPPDVRKTGIDFSKYPQVGSKDGKYQLFGVTNYFCPDCRKANAELTDLFKVYGKELNYVHIGHTFNVNDVGMDSIIAGNCVHKVDSSLYWKFQDEMFTNPAYSDIRIFDNVKLKKNLEKSIAKIGLDKKKFFECMLDKDIRYSASDSLKFFQKLNVSRTPVFFLNGRELNYLDLKSLKSAFELMRKKLDSQEK